MISQTLKFINIIIIIMKDPGHPPGCWHIHRYALNNAALRILGPVVWVMVRHAQKC